ncbi:hypothetical protein COLO4_04818 [Corchorus olitorius]|uniref:Uncharacterized protein n=1 Tax=Corchorus olitorius TaxID=93759 RepID=A0A1R3KSP3_9ROSI|nr:hypothetical protein COLO4_04818 [Corchorus olitorius]
MGRGIGNYFKKKERSVLKTSNLPLNPPKSNVYRRPKSEITQAPLEPPPLTSNFIQTSS